MAPRIGGCPDYASGGCTSCPSGWCCRRYGMASLSVNAIKAHAPVVVATGGGGGEDDTEPPDLPPDEGITADEAIRRSWRRTITRWRAESAIGSSSTPALEPARPDLGPTSLTTTKEITA